MAGDISASRRDAVQHLPQLSSREILGAGMQSADPGDRLPIVVFIAGVRETGNIKHKFFYQ